MGDGWCLRCGVSHAYRGRQRELRERERGGGRAFMRYKWFRAPWPLVGWIGMPCDFSAESFRQPTTRYPSKEPVCGKRLIRVIRAPIGRGRRPHRRLQLCSVLIASLSLFGLPIAARAMAPNSSRNFGEQDFVTSHKPWSLQFSDFVKKIKFCLA